MVQSVQASPGEPVAGQTFTLSATVQNIGCGAAAATTLRYDHYRSRSQERVVVGSDGVGTLSASASSLESIRLAGPSRAGTYHYNACVASVVGEPDRENCYREPAVDGDGGRRRRAGPRWWMRFARAPER